MEKKTLNLLLAISSLGLAIGGLIFVAISIFGKDVPSWILPAGIFCAVLSNLFNIVRTTILKVL
ncbi:MAG: hypothetical protein Q4B85_04940 [Lachnospiraceae bacterium]|nr:hypothetical protein [Lachnospiraceae bacterium]